MLTFLHRTVSAALKNAASRTQTEALWDQCSAAKDCPASRQLCALPGTEVRDVAADLRVHQPCCVRCINGNVDKHCPSHHIISSIAEKNQKPTKISQEAISNTIQLCSFWLSAVTGSFLSFLFFLPSKLCVLVSSIRMMQNRFLRQHSFLQPKNHPGKLYIPSPADVYSRLFVLLVWTCFILKLKKKNLLWIISRTTNRAKNT